MAAFGRVLLFSGYEPVHGAELWKSDGTATGTVLVKDIEPLPNTGSHPSQLTLAGDTMVSMASVTRLDRREDRGVPARGLLGLSCAPEGRDDAGGALPDHGLPFLVRPV